MLDRVVIMNQETWIPRPYCHMYLQISLQFAFTILHFVNRVWVYGLQQFYLQKLLTYLHMVVVVDKSIAIFTSLKTY